MNVTDTSMDPIVEKSEDIKDLSESATLYVPIVEVVEVSNHVPSPPKKMEIVCGLSAASDPKKFRKKSKHGDRED
ncbi:hypothetical protein BRARA_C02543 [Brassica rapa]|uniref:Uncharacterized protein n=1 Tax=Brassica campestris TaxID=3711 RepID=A0A398A4H2_BRACM|nr:hypothetical protein BRARA_C02543 [Brassica rapa]